MWQIPMSRQHSSRLARFLLVGGSGVVVNSAALYLFHEFVGLPVVVASVLAVELAIVNNFVLNDNWTFRQAPAHVELRAWNRFLRFNLVSVGGLVITTGVLYLLTTAGTYYLLANLLGIGLATIWNFVLNTVWTWTTSP